MGRQLVSRAVLISLIVASTWGVIAPGVRANHSLGVHWPRTGNPFVVQLGNNLTTGEWSTVLANVSAAWSQSNVLDTVVADGQGQGVCQANPGRVEVCNGDFSGSDWLGLAEVWVDKNGHIVQATVKLNDSRFVPGTYNDYAKRNVLCEEVGHVLGLDHQRDPSSKSCMDDLHGINDPEWAAPNAHDFEQLARIYRHRDSKAKAGSPSQVVALGQAAPSADDRRPVFVRDAGDGMTVYSWVFWPAA